MWTATAATSTGGRASLNDEVLIGGAANDTLQGGFGADYLNGGEGDDQLVTQGPEGTTKRAGSGNDAVVALGSGQDQLWGGEGRERFEFLAIKPPTAGANDLIMDWESPDTLSFADVGILTSSSILPLSYSQSWPTNTLRRCGSRTSTSRRGPSTWPLRSAAT